MIVVVPFNSKFLKKKYKKRDSDIKKLIEYSIDLLRENNITEIIINSHYLHEKISEFINRKYPNISLSYEKNILDTGGGILNAMSFFDQENFFVLNSDTVKLFHISGDLQ